MGDALLRRLRAQQAQRPDTGEITAALTHPMGAAAAAKQYRSSRLDSIESEEALQLGAEPSCTVVEVCGRTYEKIL